MVNKRLLDEEMKAWIRSAVSSLPSDRVAAESASLMASEIQQRARLRKSYDQKLLFCKKCKAFSPPALLSTVRIRSGTLVVKCSQCGGVYRHPLK